MDFAWLSGRIVIEVDGGQHNTIRDEADDGKRTNWLAAQGFEVLRFWNNDVLRNGEGCQQVIAEMIEKRRKLSFMN